MSDKTYNTKTALNKDTLGAIRLNSPDLPQPSALYPIRPADPLRRDFIAECLDHVSRVACNAAYAIVAGDDSLYEVQIELMRTTMREAIRTYSELPKAASND
jgi:hypothetical protein